LQQSCRCPEKTQKSQMTTTKSLQLRSTLQHDILPESGKPKRGDSNPSNKSSYAVSPHNSSNKSSCKGCSIEKNIATLSCCELGETRTLLSQGVFCRGEHCNRDHASGDPRCNREHAPIEAFRKQACGKHVKTEKRGFCGRHRYEARF